MAPRLGLPLTSLAKTTSTLSVVDLNDEQTGSRVARGIPSINKSQKGWIGMFSFHSQISTTKPPPHPSRPPITAHLILRHLHGRGKHPRPVVEEDEEGVVVIHASAWLDPCWPKRHYPDLSLKGLCRNKDGGCRQPANWSRFPIKMSGYFSFLILKDDFLYRRTLFSSIFIDTMGLKLHHLPPNAITYLSSFVALCENFIGPKREGLEGIDLLSACISHHIQPLEDRERCMYTYQG